MARPYKSYTLGKSEFVVDSRYINLKPIGRGAYGLVASAEDTISGRKVAIKRISRVFSDLIDAKRILRELKLLRHFGRHDNIIEIWDIMTGPPETEDFHTLYIVTQLFECDLERIISSPQKLTDQHAQYFVYQILRGMKFVHSARVLHRDLKPSNLLVNSNCDLAIADFGLARGISERGDTRLTEYVVTRWYRAPELLCEADMYGTPVDVWAVGCIFAEILGRKPLFRGGSTREQLELIISKLGTPKGDDLRGVSSRHVLDTIARLGEKSAIPWADLFPGANPMALDLLSKMLMYDQHRRWTVDECLAHPYLYELHSRAKEPRCMVPFDWSFEADYPEEMPQKLLQHHMFTEMVAMRREQAAGRGGVAAPLAAPVSATGAAATAAGSTPMEDATAPATGTGVPVDSAGGVLPSAGAGAPVGGSIPMEM